MDKKVKYWIELAEYDLKTAHVMQKGKRFLYVGFMCHQVIEKSLKGYYVFIKRDNPPYTHNLTYLAEQSGLYQKVMDNYRDTIDILEPLNIQTRYPPHKEKILKSLDKKRCQEIIQLTEGLY